MAEEKAPAWEQVVKDVKGVAVDRLHVPGGWLYREHQFGVVVFVPFSTPPAICVPQLPQYPQYPQATCNY